MSEDNLDITVVASPLVDKEISEPREKRLLEYVRDNFNPNLFYYPASGFDTLPRQAFGDKCINGTLTESMTYFTKSKQDVIADYRKNPFRKGEFDLVYLHYLTGQPSLDEGLPELYSMISPGGHLIWVDEDFYEKQQEVLNILIELGLKNVTPKEFSTPLGEYNKGLKTEGGHKIIIFEKQK
jgi:hypothetical protein